MHPSLWERQLLASASPSSIALAGNANGGMHGVESPVSDSILSSTPFKKEQHAPQFVGKTVTGFSKSLIHSTGWQCQWWHGVSMYVHVQESRREE